jgi:phage baseplate assembly protein W
MDGDDLRNDSFFGTGQALQVGSGGGYAVQEGPSGLRKRLLRMLTTPLGTDPSDPLFGTQLAFKEIVVNPAGQRALILAQVLRDPEVGAAKVSLDVSDGGVATILIVAAMKAGGQQSATFVVDEGGVRLA